MRTTAIRAVGLLVLVVIACAWVFAEEPRWAAPAVHRSISIRPRATDTPIDWSVFKDELAKAEVVFVGETHHDETTHRVELALLEELARRTQGRLVLAMEMFERDVQRYLDDYLASKIDERTFLAHARPWPNYHTAYRPLVEFARGAGIRVVASNFPRPLLRHVAEAGANWRSRLGEEERAWVPTQLFPHPETYWRRVDNAVRGHAEFLRTSDRLLSTQSLWDNAMADTCAQLLTEDSQRLVLHINGDFHSAYGQGVVYQLLQRRPQTRVKTVSLVPTTDPATARWFGSSPADYLVFVAALAAEKEEGRFSVLTTQRAKYALSVPPSASYDRRVPLLICLADDGLRAEDALQWWSARLADQAAILAVEPRYRETQPEMELGGRWYWPDSFTEDVGTTVNAIQEMWAYAARHFPIDPDTVVVAGEGTGATVAVAAAVWSERPSVTAIALRPRHYQKLRDLPLPLPELWGNYFPPKRKIRLLLDSSDVGRWQAELQAWRDVGIGADVFELGKSGSELQQWEQAVRQGLHLPQLSSVAPEELAYLVVPYDSPRARHWARMQAEWLRQAEGVPVAVVALPPENTPARIISIDLEPERFLADDGLPRCPGPFGGTTVILLPPETAPETVERWVELETQDPLARQSRFHRVRVATISGPRDLTTVLERLESENRKNILIVPATFYADPGWLREVRKKVAPWENRLTVHWLAGLGGSQAALRKSSAGTSLHYQIQAKLYPATHEVDVVCKVRLPGDLRKAPVRFALDEQVSLQRSSSPVRLIDQTASGQKRYELTEYAGGAWIELAYRARFDYPLSDQKEEYARGFRQTRGWIGPEGVFLEGASRWLPFFDDRLVTFQLEVTLPEGWHVISQGEGTSRDAGGVARWTPSMPTEEVFLVGGPLTVESDSLGNIDLLVYLRQPDTALARKYLEVGAQYLNMYQQMLGPYLYKKFAVVENFWETGYGMPSFTLLGPQVIRFPFILHSSYPHEILHNWWGNGVFVDYGQGNWSEGLTAYLADHLVQEQRGAGAEYRRNALQRYRDYVRAGRDFPLAEFHSRHDAATEAVGYAKAMMVFHAVRKQIGDEAFRAGLADFYRRFRGQRATVADLCKAWEQATGRSLQDYLDAWWNRAGAPSLQVHDVRVIQRDDGTYRLVGRLVQTHTTTPFPLAVPVFVQTEAGTKNELFVFRDAEYAFTIDTNARPLALYVDPFFDVFRQLDVRETPPTVSGLFGREQVVAVLSRKASPEVKAGYQQLIEAWSTNDRRLTTVWDDELKELPSDQAVWLLGLENQWLEKFLPEESPWTYAAQNGIVRLDQEAVSIADQTLVLVRRHPANQDVPIGWISVASRQAFPGLARKLPHYGKYSYLAFVGDEPTNTVKGQWSTEDSPLVVDVRRERTGRLPALEVPQKALAELPPAFSAHLLEAHVAWLAHPERQGRGVGTAGLNAAAHYIADAMNKAGLLPAGDNHTYFQAFKIPGPDGAPVECYNVVGLLPGKRNEWSEQSVILSAHYDHLGYGWPDVRSGHEGQLHPGADDNASGVAVMLEVARALAQQGGGDRSLLVIAFSAEEANRSGSRYYVEHPVRPLSQVRGVINLDSVGRLGKGSILVLGTASAEEWQHIFRGCSFVTGVPSRNVAEDVGGSDQVSFLEKGIPAVQIFTGPHEDYHRPTDTADKIEAAGLVKVASFVKEAVEYLLSREPPLTVRLGASTSEAAPQEGTRRVMLGIVPSYEFMGPGVKIEATVQGSPAERAGLKAGDILVQFQGQPIADLRAYAQMLRGTQPGQEVSITIERDGQRKELKMRLEKR